MEFEIIFKYFAKRLLFLFLHETCLEDESARSVDELCIVGESDLVDSSLFEHRLGTLHREILDEENLISVREKRSVCVFGFY